MPTKSHTSYTRRHPRQHQLAGSPHQQQGEMVNPTVSAVRGPRIAWLRFVLDPLAANKPPVDLDERQDNPAILPASLTWIMTKESGAIYERRDKG